MHRHVLIQCAPLLGLLALSLLAARGLIALSGARPRLRRAAGLHRDERGGVQSLSFVLTVPVFMMVMMFIVQLSQITIAKVVVEYAAFAAARAAMVWIPANLAPEGEGENQISELVYLGDEPGADEEDWIDSVYAVYPAGPKYGKIRLAAVLACLPICPSRYGGQASADPGTAALAPLWDAYRRFAPAAAANPRAAWRLRNKLAYALEHTWVRLRVRHRESEPPLEQYGIPPYPEEFAPNEIGFRDEIHVEVTHEFALLPGPGRLLARPAPRPPDPSGEGGGWIDVDRVAASIRREDGLYVYPLQAVARLSNEGEKPVLPYVQSLNGYVPYWPPPDAAEDWADEEQDDGDTTADELFGDDPAPR